MSEQAAIPDVATTWNGQWGGGATAGLMWARVGSDAFATRVADALNERVAAMAWHRGPWFDGRPRRGVSPAAFLSAEDGDLYEYGPIYSSVVPAPGYNPDPTVLHPEPNAPLVASYRAPYSGFWNRLQHKIGGRVFFPFNFPSGLMGRYAPASAEWAGQVDIPPPWYFLHDPLILPDNAFRRKFPLEISSLSTGGSVGQVARFVRVDATPETEWGHSGKLFVHNGQTWVPSADPTHSPDVLTAYGYAQPGDYFGPWIAEDIKTQLHRMEVLALTEKPVYSGFVPGVGYYYFYSRISIAAPGDVWGASAGLDGSTTPRTHTQGADAYVFNESWVDSEIYPAAMAIQNGHWMRTRYRVYSDRLPLPPTGAGCMARGFVHAHRFYYSRGPFDPDPYAPFDAFGDGVVENVWAALGPAEFVKGTYQSPQQGSLTPLALNAGPNGYVGLIGLWMNWNVEGGFKYSPLSA